MLSKLTLRLLGGEENEEVDFKQGVPRNFAEHLVAFANAQGGYIIIGAEEYEEENGAQRGRLVRGRGIPLTDSKKQEIQNCFEDIREDLSPSIELLAEEHEDNHGIYRIHIPEGTNKPYCTAGGTYTIRRNGRKQALLPTTMRKLLGTLPKTVELSNRVEELIKEATELGTSPDWDDAVQRQFRSHIETIRKTLIHPLLSGTDFRTRFDSKNWGGRSGKADTQVGFRGKWFYSHLTGLQHILDLLDEVKTYLDYLSGAPPIAGQRVPHPDTD